MEKQLKKNFHDFKKGKEIKGFEVSLNEAVSEIELLFNTRVQKLEQQIKIFKEIDSQINFMLNKKLKELE